MQKLITSILIGTLLILPGCLGFGGGDGGGETPPTEVLTFYRLVESSEFSLQVPEDWETIQHFTSSYPDNTIVAFRNNVQDHHFVANINVTRNTVEEGTTTRDYALEMSETVANQLLNFELLNEEETTIFVDGVGQETFLYEFKGTNDPTIAPRRFIQTYGVSGTQGYVITGTYAHDDTELAIDQVKQSIPTFMVK